jgi:SAM-dependent methyltransferase
VKAGSLYGTLLEEPAPALLRHEDGTVAPLALDRFLGRTSIADEFVASIANGPVLDVGCGPGRLLDALERHGTWALGVDRSRAAVGLARQQRRRVIHRDVFGPLPATGQWGTVLLLDGNVGIGGDPTALFERVSPLLRPGGRILAEVDPPGAATTCGRVRLETPRTTSTWFRWASVGHDGAASVAAAAGLAVQETLCTEGRWFAFLG